MPATPSLQGLFITGSDTGVGKTQVGAVLAHGLHQQGVTVRVRKPIESGATATADGLLPEDAQLLNHAAGEPDPPGIVCRYPLAAVASPQRAAALEGKSYRLQQLQQACLQGLDPGDYVLIEGAGGFNSPLCDDGLNADLAQSLGLPVLLVVTDRLGCINHTLLTLEAIAGRGLTTAAIALNQTQKSLGDDTDNLDELSRWCQPPVIALPHSDSSPPWIGLPFSKLQGLYRRHD